MHFNDMANHRGTKQRGTKQRAQHRAGRCGFVFVCALLASTACKAGGDGGANGESKTLLGPESAKELERLFEPMQVEGTVACDNLAVGTHRALWDRFTYPSRSEFCEITFEKLGEGSRYSFRNVGGLDYPMKFIIGKRIFLVIETAVLEVQGGAPRFEVEARGNVVAQASGASLSEAGSVRVENGTWTLR